jgi:hypothetical protein
VRVTDALFVNAQDNAAFWGTYLHARAYTACSTVVDINTCCLLDLRGM